MKTLYLDARDSLPKDEISKFLQKANYFADESRKIIESIVKIGLAVKTKADRTLVTKADIEIEAFIRQEVSSLFPEHGVIGEEFAAINPEADFQWIIDPIDGTEEFVHGVPTYGSIIGLHFKKLPLVGLMDHPALELRLAAAWKQGAWKQGATRNNIAIGSIDESIDTSMSKPASEIRLGISKRKNFLRFENEEEIFNQVTHHFPNLRVFDSCYAHTLAALGALDVVVEFNLKTWDLCAAEVIIPEVGGRYVLFLEREASNGLLNKCVVFGKPWAVDAVMTVLKPYDDRIRPRGRLAANYQLF